MNRVLIPFLWLQRQKPEQNCFRPPVPWGATIPICHPRHHFVGRWGPVCEACHLVGCLPERSTLPFSPLPSLKPTPSTSGLGWDGAEFREPPKHLLCLSCPNFLTSLSSLQTNPTFVHWIFFLSSMTHFFFLLLQNRKAIWVLRQ